MERKVSCLPNNYVGASRILSTLLGQHVGHDSPLLYSSLPQLLMGFNFDWCIIADCDISCAIMLFYVVETLRYPGVPILG